MKRARVWLGATVLVSFVACGSGDEGNAYKPTPAFVEQLKAKATALMNSELARFNEMELASKDEMRYEVIENPLADAGAVFFKEFRDYTLCRLVDIEINDSYLYPIVFVFEYEYGLMATPMRHDSIASSLQDAQKDTEYKLERTDKAIVRYRADQFGKLIDPLPELLPRDSLIDAAWNKRPGVPAVSKVLAPPPGSLN